MGLRIQTNTQAINAHRALWTNDLQMAKSLDRLSSGFRVNRAADDAAGLSMSMKFVADIRAMGAAPRNVSQASSLLEIAEGGEDQIVAMLQRLKELAQELGLPPEMGLIVRTVSAEGKKRELGKDLQYLLKLWGDIGAAAKDPAIKTVLDMATWRKNYLAWIQNAQQANRSVQVSPSTP